MPLPDGFMLDQSPAPTPPGGFMLDQGPQLPAGFSLDEPSPADDGAQPVKQNVETGAKSEAPGILSALGKGGMEGLRSIAESAKQTGQLAGGAQPEAAPELPADEKQLAAPFDLFSMPNAQTLPKAAYHFAQGLLGGAPELATALAAGGAATMATRNPIVGLLTGAGGAGAVYVVRQIAPNFAAELKTHPDDPDLAWKQAIEKTSIGGVTTAAGFAAFGLNPFEGELKNLAFQAFGLQPAISMGSKAVENKVEGKPATEGLGSEYVESALGTVGPYAAMRPFHRGGGAETQPGPEQDEAGTEGAPPGNGPPRPPQSPGEAFRAEPPDFIKSAEPPPDDQGPHGGSSGPQSFKIDPAAYGVDISGMPPEKAEAAVQAATSTEQAATVLRDAMADLPPHVAARFPIPDFLKEKSQNASATGLPEGTALSGDEGGGQPTPPGRGETARGEPGIDSGTGNGPSPAAGQGVRERAQTAPAETGGAAGTSPGSDRANTATQEPAGRGEPVQPSAQAAPDTEAAVTRVGDLDGKDLQMFRRNVSRATGQKGVPVYMHGEGAEFDPLTRSLTVGANVPADAVPHVAALAKGEDPPGWRDAEIEGTADDNSMVKMSAGDAADDLGARYRRALGVLECLA